MGEENSNDENRKAALEKGNNSQISNITRTDDVYVLLGFLCKK